MALKNLFRRNEPAMPVDRIVEEMQKVDAWLMVDAPTYNLNFDTTVPTRPAREKYIPIENQRQRYESFRKNWTSFIDENFYVSGNMYNLYDLYKWVELCLTTAFQMVAHTPSNYILTFVNFNEAVGFFDNVFLETEELCKTIIQNMKQIEFELTEVRYFDGDKGETISEFVQYENGVKKIRDRKEPEQCIQLLNMLLEFRKYTEYLFSVTQYIYENSLYVLCGNSRYKTIRNWEVFYNKILCHISIGNRKHGITTEDDFLKLIR